MKHKFKFHSDLAKGQKVPYISLLYLENEKVQGKPIAFPLAWKDKTNVFTNGEVDFIEGEVIIIEDGQGPIIYHIEEEKLKMIGPLNYEEYPLESFNVFREAEEILKKQSYRDIIRRDFRIQIQKLEEEHEKEIAAKVTKISDFRAEISNLRAANRDYSKRIDNLVTDVNLLLEAESIARKIAEKFQARIKELETDIKFLNEMI